MRSRPEFSEDLDYCFIETFIPCGQRPSPAWRFERGVRREAEINQKTYLRNSPEGVGASGGMFKFLNTRDAAVVIQPPMMDKE